MLIISYNCDSAMIPGLTILNDVSVASMKLAIIPSISRPFSMEKIAPNSLLSHPSIANFNIASRLLPSRVKTMTTTININAKDIILIICSLPSIHCEMYSPVIVANLQEAHKPTMMEMMEMI